MPETRRSPGRSLSAARATVTACLIALGLLAGAADASAYTVIGAYFTPTHAPAGAKVMVTGLPLATDCPKVEVWLAPGLTPSPPIASTDDPRLIRLAGTVGTIPGGIGTGGSALATKFTFKVPRIEPGPYSTFSRCSGSAGFGEMSPGDTTFTVDPFAPATDTATTDTTRPAPAPAGSVVIIVASLAILAGYGVQRRTARAARP